MFWRRLSARAMPGSREDISRPHRDRLQPESAKEHGNRLGGDPAGKVEIMGEAVPPPLTKGRFNDATDRVMAVLEDARTGKPRRGGAKLSEALAPG